MKIGVDLVSPRARLLVWAAIPLGVEAELVPSDLTSPDYDRLLRFSPEAFAGDERAHPGTRAIEAYADLLIQKRLFRAIGLPTPPFGRVRGAGEWEAMVMVGGLPAWLRERSGGRDRLVEDRGFSPPEGSYLYERALPYDAELLLPAARSGDRIRCYLPARRSGEVWVAPYPLDAKLEEPLCEQLMRLFLALGHDGGLEVRAGLFKGKLHFLDFVPFPTERSLYLPAFAEAHLRGILGYALPRDEPAGHVAVAPVENLGRALESAFARPFVLDRPYVRVEGPTEEALLERLAEVGAA